MLITIFLCMITGATHAMDDAKMPDKDPLSSGYPTLNAHGFVFEPTDPMSMQFRQAITEHRTDNSETNILEIGPGYGFLAESILKYSHPNNNCIYTGLDLGSKHLEIATKRMQDKGIFATAIGTQWIPEVGSFPDIEYPENSFTHIIASRVIHFYTPDLFKQALRTLEKVLKPKGQAYIFTCHINITAVFGEGIYDMYKDAKQKGKEFPGFIDDLPNVVNRLAQSGSFSKQYAEDPTFKKSLAKHMLFFTNKELCAAVMRYTRLNIVCSQTIHGYKDGKRKSNIGIVLEKE
jgi:ubiquinone/menaquinone biosynthesis C-methylase UbiE